MTINEILLNYLDTYKGIERYGEDKYVSLEWNDKNIVFGINENTMPNGGVVARDVVGNITKGHSFMFSAFFDYTEDKAKMIENSSFFEDFSYWIYDNNRKGVLPKFEEDDGRRAVSIEVVQTPFLFMVDPNQTEAQYSVVLQFNYRERR